MNEDTEILQRKLDEIGNTEWKRQSVTFDNCLLKGNRQGLESTLGTNIRRFSVIEILGDFDDIEIKDCIFTENNFGDPDDAVRCEILSCMHLLWLNWPQFFLPIIVTARPCYRIPC
jgi:hypothetical protein